MKDGLEATTKVKGLISFAKARIFLLVDLREFFYEI